MTKDISDYTEQEFIELLTIIFRGPSGYTEKEYDTFVHEFVKLSGHPAGTDLIFYPEDDADNSPEGIAKVVHEYRKSKGLTTFKE